MSRLDVPPRSRAFSHIAVFSLIAVAAAGCADSARISSREVPPQDVTGSVASASGEPRRDAHAAGAEPAGDGDLQRTGARLSSASAHERRHRLGCRDRGIGPGTAALRSRSTRARRSRPSRAAMAFRCRRFCRPTALPAKPRSGRGSAWSFRATCRRARPRMLRRLRRPRLRMRACISSRPGESLMSISRKYGVSLSALARANKIQALFADFASATA